MYITIETKTEQWFVEATGCSLGPVTPRQNSEPESPKTKLLIVHALDGDRVCYELEPGDWVFVMNDSGRTVNKFEI
ncbi:hypothetical protein LCGC14_1605460 [marine sediment metagenome]|uniref:Uncharacterized protein n=1 Tax=marine sediment metagenome TaxID=412755 RepID=A0A0F9KQL7_9ZZZZ